MQQIQTDVLQLTGKLLLKNKTRCSFSPRFWQNGHTYDEAALVASLTLRTFWK